ITRTTLEGSEMTVADRARHGLLGTAALVSVACMLASLPTGAMAADQALIEAAQKEGRVTWYTTQQIDSVVRPLSEAFEAKYGIKVEYVRASTAEVALRVYNEGQAGQMVADVFDGSSAGENLKRANLVLQWLPDTVGTELGKELA